MYFGFVAALLQAKYIPRPLDTNQKRGTVAVPRFLCSSFD
ncbi:hypothetical protein MITSMUL_04165 [Mitsuokella multacida DSM 20544]|uniref:Uncharacterized protein n=1 Tax=Mitsuokella multacida DSM 20544 TaxID=500635 RepID=C9KLT1_9FIRM|nr:hypothetical protein MITSMUL_04165 [Mitsuokella multacida DSM 20544]